MDNKKDVKVDFIVYESTMNRLERTNKRMFNLNIILIIVLFLVIAGIIVYSMIPSDYNSQNIDNVDNMSNAQVNNGSK